MLKLNEYKSLLRQRRFKFMPVFMLASACCLTGCRGGMVDEGCYWGPQPNEKSLMELRDKGIKTIVMVRLNPMRKIEQQARALGMNYVHIPTGLFRSPPEESMQKFLNVARDPQMRPLYVCDQVARDRTQFYAGIYGMVSKGWTAERASWQMYRNGLRHWWPWFYKYKDIVKAHENEIRSGLPLRSADSADSTMNIQ